MVYEQFDDRKENLLRDKENAHKQNRSLIDTANTELSNDQKRAYDNYAKELDNIKSSIKFDSKNNFLTQNENNFLNKLLKNSSVFNDTLLVPSSKSVADFTLVVPVSLDGERARLLRERESCESKTRSAIEPIKYIDISSVIKSFQSELLK